MDNSICGDRPPMSARSWNTGELKVLRQYAGLGRDAVAAILERSPGSVASKARELGVSLEASGADVDVAGSSARILQRVRQAIGAGICPLCGKRLAIMKSTGICRVCHLDQLISLREVQLLEVARERRLTKLRQEKRRLRICDGCGKPFFPRVGSASAACSECEPVTR